MLKKELRLAVVIYGGASLAVYMHGVSKELLKLVRASKVFHEMERERALNASFTDSADHRDPDTETVYFELIRRINEHCHFRVVVDVIAGASAGAINGVMLGKAIVDDGLLGAQTSLWLNDADVEYFVDEDRSPWQKWYLEPLLRLLSFWLPKDISSNAETREKLAHIVRSSWFQPPFSGKRVAGHFLDGLKSMIKTRREGSTLLPPGQRLDVYASITDLKGYPTTVRLNEQLIARERQHSAYCQLSHVSNPDSWESSDFHDDNIPALVWASRASSSYAGAFEPFHHDELKRLLAARGMDWPGEAAFLRENLFVRNGIPAYQVFDPADRHFVDGGIVNNKPFVAAMHALNQRPADRHVDRFIVYIEPDPNTEIMGESGDQPGYMSTIHAALSSIPRNQPILDELNEIMAQDKRVRINRRVVESNQARIEAIVQGLESRSETRISDPGRIEFLRLGVSGEAINEMGMAYEAYLQRRVWRLIEALTDSWVQLAEQPHLQETRLAMESSIANWWATSENGARHSLQIEFLDLFDVTYRIRRLQFVIRRLNQHEEQDPLDDAARDVMDNFKRVSYEFLDRFYDLRGARLIEDALIEQLYLAARQIPLPPDAARELLQALSGSLDLVAMDREVDAAFYEFYEGIGSAELRHAFLTDYVGFPVYDVLLFSPGSGDLAPDPLTSIQVERVSPQDAGGLKPAFSGLRSRSFMGFLGFFNREYREHDYLWGRLNGADRLVDILERVASDGIDEIEVLRRELFESIVERERHRLYRCDDDFARLDAELARMAEK